MNPYLILGYFRAKPTTSQLPSGFGASNIFQVKHYSDSSRHRQKFREECVTVPFRPQGLHAFTSRRWICYNTITVFILEIEILVAEKWKKESAKKNSRSVKEQLAFCRSQQLRTTFLNLLFIMAFMLSRHVLRRLPIDASRGLFAGSVIPGTPRILQNVFVPQNRMSVLHDRFSARFSATDAKRVAGDYPTRQQLWRVFS